MPPAAVNGRRAENSARALRLRRPRIFPIFSKPAHICHKSNAKFWTIMCAFQASLVLLQVVLPNGGEWNANHGTWCLIRVQQGAGYWIGEKSRQELNPGSVVLLSRLGHGMIWASQLGELRLQYFTVNPASLGGFLTMGERQFLESSANQVQFQVQIFPDKHKIAQCFAELMTRHESSSGLVTRCRLLLLFAEVFPNWSSVLESNQASNKAGDRFQRLMGLLSEADFQSSSADSLAAICGCSVRHFTRLFRQRFGISFKQKQMELRLPCQESALFRVRR